MCIYRNHKHIPVFDAVSSCENPPISDKNSSTEVKGGVTGILASSQGHLLIKGKLKYKSMVKTSTKQA